MEKEILLSSAYLAPVEYYTKLYAYDKVYVERFDHYAKQTYRNRCVIASAAGPLALTIPTEKSDEQKCLMKDVRISDHGNWRHVHWNAFVAGYKHSRSLIIMLMNSRSFTSGGILSCMISMLICAGGYAGNWICNLALYLLMIFVYHPKG